MKKKYFSVSRNDECGYFVSQERLFTAGDLDLEYCEIGDVITLTVVEMEEEEFENLPEFPGW